MSPPKRTITGMSIVVVGAWNPAIFVPRWFGDVGLISPEEADSADVALVHPEIAQWDMQWLHVQVAREKLTVSTSQERYFEPVRDLAVGVLQLVPHTPTSMLGMNTDWVVQFDDRDSYDEFGWTLVSPRMARSRSARHGSRLSSG